MDTFKSNTAKGVKNVARKSTSNRPLKVNNNKSADMADISNLNSKNVNKVLESWQPSVDFQSPENVSDDECETDGVFLMSGSMMEYLKQSQLSPTKFYDSDEAKDPAGVLNYPVKYEFPSFANKEFVEELPTSEGNSEINTIQIVCSTSDNAEMEPVKPLINKQKIIKDTFCIVDQNSSHFTNDKKAVIMVSEDVPVNDNKSATNTVINPVEVLSSKNVSYFENNAESELRIEFTTTCYSLWHDFLPIEKSVQDQYISHSPAVKLEKDKKPGKKVSFTLGKKKDITTKKGLLNKIIEQSVPNGMHTQTTRKINQSKFTTPPKPKRKKSFSNILSKANLNHTEDVSEHSDAKTEECKSGIENGSNINNKKDTTKCKKRKNIINEGILLHVEAAKKINIMRDGKILKDKKDLLKGLDATIDENLPVEVDKNNFKIQQSLVEEILLDQAHRLAHQRTSPRRRPLLNASEAKEIVNSLTSQNNKRKQSYIIKSNSLESTEKQTPSCSKNLSESESDCKQNVNDENQVKKTDTSSNIKNHKKKSSLSKQINNIKKILKQMANKLELSKDDLCKLSKTVEDVIKIIEGEKKERKIHEHHLMT